MVFWHVVGDLIALPKYVLRSVADFLRDLERAAFCMELDAARRYKLLTGSDLGYAAGETHRYSGLDPQRAEAAQSKDDDDSA
jgi:hypothetical protein